MVKVIELNSREQVPQVFDVQPTNWNEYVGKNNWFRNRTNTQILIGIVILICTTTVITCLAFILLSNIRLSNNVTTEKSSTRFHSKDLTDTNSASEGAEFITRQRWHARSEKYGVGILKLPVSYVVIHHTATEDCTTLSECKERVQTIQDFHIDSNGWSDIGYNFLIGGNDGYIFEGRGWTKSGAHVKDYNSVSIGITFIGLFENELPSNTSLSAAQKLLKTGVEEHYITEDYKLFGMRQLSKFSSPGQKLMK